MGTLTICCPCLFGLESVLSGEIKDAKTVAAVLKAKLLLDL